MIKLSPSILAADPLRLGEAARLAAKLGCDELHFDVMDGHFVPNLSFGPALLGALKKEVPMTYDVHLMLSDPLGFIDVFAKNGADIITVHAEANGFEESLDRIHSLGLQAGASLKPKTGVNALRGVLGKLDRVLLMTVEPGFGGQSLMLEVLDKARELRALGFGGDIEADGGINADNAHLLAEKGVNVLVMGTAFFRSSAPEAVVEKVHSLHTNRDIL